MYLKDVATLVLRRFRNVLENPKLKDLNLLWKYILTLVEPNFFNEQAATMEVLILRKDVTRQMAWTSMNASKSRNIDDQAALIEKEPMMIRSVLGYKWCVDSKFQNISVPPRLQTVFYFVFVKTGHDDPEVVYKLGIRSGIDHFAHGEIGVSKVWHNDESYMAGINGPASYQDGITKEVIKVTSDNPLDKNTFGTWFIVDGEQLDMQPGQVCFNKTKQGFYFQGTIPGSAFVAHENPKTLQIKLHNRARFEAFGKDRTNYYQDWVSKRMSTGKPLKKENLIHEEPDEDPDAPERSAEEKKEDADRLYRKDD